MNAAFNPLRRYLLRSASASAAAGLLAATGLLHARRVLAADWPKPQPAPALAFTTPQFAEALRLHGMSESTEIAATAREIEIKAPDIAENGANVPVEISTSLPGAQTIAVFAEKNPLPLVASLHFAAEAVPYARIQVKLAESMRLRVVVRTTSGRNYHTSREIKVTLGGCGA